MTIQAIQILFLLFDGVLQQKLWRIVTGSTLCIAGLFGFIWARWYGSGCTGHAQTNTPAVSAGRASI